MTKKQNRSKADLLHERVASFNRESLPPKEVVRQTTKDIERRFSEELRKQYAERRAIAESLKKIHAPLAHIVNKDKSAVAEQRRLRERLSQRMKHKPAPPKIRPAKSMIKPGSILTTVTPPYDYTWQWVDPDNTGGADAGTDNSNGNFGGDARSYYDPYDPSGYGQAAAGFGVAFHPTNLFSLLTIYYQLRYNVSWYENSSFDTAHTNGSSSILIYQYDLNWNYQGLISNTSVPIWSDGTGWLETHSGGTSVTESFNPSPLLLLFYSNYNYILWFIGRWYADGAGSPDDAFNAQAQCWIDANLPFVLLEHN